MDWARYKALCDQPDVWSGWMLEQCVELFTMQGDAPLAARLTAARNTEPIETPEGYKGTAATAMYVLDLKHEEKQRALQLIKSALRDNLRTSATAARGLGGFLEAWTEYAHYTSPLSDA